MDISLVEKSSTFKTGFNADWVPFTQVGSEKRFVSAEEHLSKTYNLVAEPHKVTHFIPILNWKVTLNSHFDIISKCNLLYSCISHCREVRLNSCKPWSAFLSILFTLWCTFLVICVYTHMCMRMWISVVSWWYSCYLERRKQFDGCSGCHVFSCSFLINHSFEHVTQTYCGKTVAHHTWFAYHTTSSVDVLHSNEYLCDAINRCYSRLRRMSTYCLAMTMLTKDKYVDWMRLIAD